MRSLSSITKFPFVNCQFLVQKFHNKYTANAFINMVKILFDQNNVI
jgi:hypothetical protein